MGNVNIAVVLLHQHVLADLISALCQLRFPSVILSTVPVDEDVVEVEVHYKVYQRLLDAGGGGAILMIVARLAPEKAD